MQNPFELMVGEVVVLDTTTPIVYIGTLVGVTEHTLVLREVDMHDCREGHAGKEEYVAATRRHGVSPNRRHIVVMMTAVISVSRLNDVETDQRMAIVPE